MAKQDEMFGIISAWKQSGIGLQKYGEQHGIAYGTLQYWNKRYRQLHQQTALPAGFVAVDLPREVRTEPSSSSSSGIVIILPSGTRIEVH